MRKNKLTKNCLEPWRSVQFFASGDIIPCCGAIKGDFGNINRDLFAKGGTSSESDLFINDEYQKLRKGLLSGDLNEACKNCRAVHEEDIPPDDLKQKVIQHLANKGGCVDGADLTKLYAFDECGGNITNKCNFSCIYCIHSSDNGHTGKLSEVMDRSHFMTLIQLLFDKGLRIFNFCGIGELTTYKGWETLCDEIFAKFPDLRLRLISNLGKTLTPPEINILTRFDLIHISCDTLEPETYALLRKGGRLPVLMENLERIKNRFATLPEPRPKLVFNVTATDVIVDKLEELFRYAANNDIFVHISSLFEMEGSVASKTKCVKKMWELPDDEMPHAREVILDLPRRMKAENSCSAIWEYKFLYDKMMKKADRVTFNRFLPCENEKIYQAFYQSYIKNPDSFLRKIWLSFDESIRGIWIRAGARISFPLPCAHGIINFRCVWLTELPDGNLKAEIGKEERHNVRNNLTLTVEKCNDERNGIILEIMNYELVNDNVDERKDIVVGAPPLGLPELFIQETMFPCGEEAIVERLVKSREPIAIWCAGLRTLQVFAKTRLSEANIKMIIDGDPQKYGQKFCGYTVRKPDDVASFDGTIVIMHASSPEKIKKHICSLGVANRIIIV